MNQNSYQGSSNGGNNQMYLQPPPDYDPRRLFPFGLSPIPEVPSELASEVSSIASYSPTPSLEDSDTEIESVRSRGSIMYSGSCDSIKSNNTIHNKSSDESSTETDSEDEELDEEDEYRPASIPPDKSPTKLDQTEKNMDVAMKSQCLTSECYSTDDLIYTEQIHVSSGINDVISADCADKAQSEEDVPESHVDLGSEDKITFPCDMVSGAATASEIFRHLQATRGKQEVTTELAKILTVLKTTLNSDDKDSSSSDEEMSNQYSKTDDPMPTGKPPRPPQKFKFSKNSPVSPAIQARIRELEANKPDNPKEEMNILSKILVHLLCSCKTAAAAHELKRIIKQFKEVAKVAMEEGDDTLDSLRSNSRASSRNSRRKMRSRTASGNSNVSGNSETDSMNTLTPGDSKSSGTDDEKESAEGNMSKLRFTSTVSDDKFTESNSCVSYTLTIPLRKAYEEVDEKQEEEEYDDEEWEWEYEDESETAISPVRNLAESSGSSRNHTPSDASTGSTRKILMDMEMGAYNSGSASHSDQGNSQSTPITEEEDGFLDDDDNKNEKNKKKVDASDSGHLFSHLEETFKVLSNTYNIITTGNSSEAVEETYSEQIENNTYTDKSFEDILDGVSNQCVQLETEIMRSSRQSTAEPELSMDSIKTKESTSRPPSRTMSIVKTSRPSSRNQQVLDTSKKDDDDAGGEEDWGDEDEWEYYYEEDYPEETEENSKELSRPNSKVCIIRSRPVSRQSVSGIKSPPIPPSMSPKPASRPASRATSRAASRASSRLVAKIASRPSSRASVANNVQVEENDEDWEWEYYYEEDYAEGSKPQNLAKEVNSRSTSRAPSRTHSRVEGPRVPSRNQIDNYCNQKEKEQEKNIQRVSSRQELLQVIAENCAAVKSGSRPPSRVVSRPVSRAKSVMSEKKTTQEEEEDWGDEDEWEYYYEEDYPDESSEVVQQNSVVSSKVEVHQAAKVPSRPSSRQSVKNDHVTIAIVKHHSRPSSRQTINASRPNSRCDSRAESRAASRIVRTTSSLGNVQEEDEYEWYYDDCDDPELGRISPSNTTAPTTRATSPFPDEKGKVEVNTGTGFSRRKLTLIKESDEITSPVSRTPTNAENISMTSRCTSIPESEKDPQGKVSATNKSGYLNSIAGVSLALAAEYLGQEPSQLAASLPAKFIEGNNVMIKEKKKKHKSKHRNDDKEDNEEKSEEKEKRRKKKGDGKFLPKVGVKELASRLEPHLFQDTHAGMKMALTREEALDVIHESKKKANELMKETPKISTPVDSKPEEKRKSVREMVQLMSTQAQEESKYCESITSTGVQSGYNIPSISVSNSMVPPPVPPPPQSYYTSPTPQYQHYPIEVHAQYAPYSQNPHSPYQQYPISSPYQQYPQQYHGYQGYPPPQAYPPQQYQQYAQYHPTQMQHYHPGYQVYPPPPMPPQPMVYQSESNPNQMKVVTGGMTTVVNMRQKNATSKSKESPTGNKPKSPSRNSPEGSEAYGTGSTGSDHTEGQPGIDHDVGVDNEESSGKTQKRHSRLFKLLQESDYTDSDTDSKSEYSRISLKNVEDNHGRESDIDSVCSGLERTGIERKHSFRSHKSSNKESDNESVHSTGVERKISPNSVQHNMKHRRFMQLNLQSNYDHSSSELSTPNSPTGMGPTDRKIRSSSSKPPSRVWNYHADDFDYVAGASDDSSYQSLQSLNSFDSVYDSVAGREVEEIMKRKVNRDNLYRYQTDSPGSGIYVRASPKSVELLRGSPKTTTASNLGSSSPKLETTYNRASPKLEQELLELTNFPSSPGLTLRQLQGHRSFYGSK